MVSTILEKDLKMTQTYDPLICICNGCFYPIEPAPDGVDSVTWAKQNGENNTHVLRIEDTKGNVLWART
jgi:hypothetical protein